MKNVIFVFLALFIVYLSTGCASIDKTMQSWVGHSANDLIASWGPPQQVFSDGQGGQVLVYTQVRQWTSPGRATTNTYGTANTYGNIYGNSYSANTYGSATSTTTYTPAQTHGYAASRTFWVNSGGGIYRYAWKGL